MGGPEHTPNYNNSITMLLLLKILALSFAAQPNNRKRKQITASLNEKALVQNEDLPSQTVLRGDSSSPYGESNAISRISDENPLKLLVYAFLVVFGPAFAVIFVVQPKDLAINEILPHLGKIFVVLCAAALAQQFVNALPDPTETGDD